MTPSYEIDWNYHILTMCFQTRIIVPSEDGRPANLEKCTNIAQSILDYFNGLPHERVEHSIEMLTHKVGINLLAIYLNAPDGVPKT